MGSELEVHDYAGIESLTIEALVEQVGTIQKAMEAVMKEGTHYGTIPGTDKPTLYKPGAEKLCFLFRLDPEYDIESSIEADNHIGYVIRCTLKHIGTGAVIATGMGSCNSKENKYRWRTRKAQNKPSQAEAEALKAEDKGFWKKLGSEWAWFDKIENKNPWELQNTILKMACKRALTAAVLNGTAASDIFAQDLEDLPEMNIEEAQVVVEPEAPKRVPAKAALLKKLSVQLVPLAEARPDLWAENVVLVNARRAFKVPVESLAELTEEEVIQIMAGAENWVEAQATLDAGEMVEEGELVELAE